MSTKTEIVYGQVAAGATCAFTALLKKLDGTSFAPSEISSIKATILDLGDYPGANPVAVTGFDNLTLTVNSVMFAETAKTYNGKTYQRNFEWIPPTNPSPFASSKHEYKVVINFTPTTGICSPLVFRVKVI